MGDNNQEELITVKESSSNVRKMSPKAIILSIIAIGVVALAVVLIVRTNNLYKQADECVVNAEYLVTQKDYKGALIKLDEAKKLNRNLDLKEKSELIDVLKFSYECFTTGMEAFNRSDYKVAYNNLKSVKEIDKDNYLVAQEKIEECKPKLIIQALEGAKKLADAKSYDSAISMINNALTNSPNNEELVNAKNKYTEMNNAKIAEEAKVKQKEEEAKAKAEEQARAEERKKYEPQKIVDKDGKQIWKIYIQNGGIHFTGKYTGSGNFIMKLLNSNQELVKVIVNEIGDYVVDKTVYVKSDGWYYLEVFGSDGTWNYNWK
ncbi:tetratricopeptide (TPR) repeat protein [Clostridium punense]|uniref:Tetratricopeptide (TPR) repeat protein n=1 Tax=Clostridium punense TaxID=1054297 RepID=A0ABS4K9K1_9CLOT|nr:MULTISPECIES: hypothetical protein [Clostridium]EQB88924.1 hypothetical protein M918_22645 [Clostridium sp. BL8]MBP2024444.1 tetratricopeptide (TPR) repeat protein [Clostridium punense]